MCRSFTYARAISAVLVMADAVLWSIWTLISVRTFLVADAVWTANGGLGVVARIADRCGRYTDHWQGSALPTSNFSPRSQGTAGAGRRIAASRFRGLHLNLLLMHATATVSASASVGRRVMPISDMGCTTTKRLTVCMLINFDTWLILFLLAKTDVTNKVNQGSTANTRPLWERAVKWFSLFWACIFLPMSVVAMWFVVSERTNDEGTACYIESASTRESRRAGAVGILLANGVILIELVLLLALFVKPLLPSSKTSNQSSATTYRRIVVRNFLCTVAILGVVAACTAVVFISYFLSSSPGQNEEMQEIMRSVRMLGILCVTEVTIPLGFTSFIASCRVRREPGSIAFTSSRTVKQGGMTAQARDAAIKSLSSAGSPEHTRQSKSTPVLSTVRKAGNQRRVVAEGAQEPALPSSPIAEGVEN